MIEYTVFSMGITSDMKKIVRLANERKTPLAKIDFDEHYVWFTYRTNPNWVQPGMFSFGYPNFEQAVKGELKRLGE